VTLLYRKALLSNSKWRHRNSDDDDDDDNDDGYGYLIDLLTLKHVT